MSDLEQVFIGKKWNLQVVKLPIGKIAGYATEATSASTYGINDSNHRNIEGFRLPKSIRTKLERLMRKHGWVEDIFLHLRSQYLHDTARVGNGMRMPVEFENKALARLYYVGDINHAMYVEHYKDQGFAYRLWLSHGKGVRCAFRGAGEQLPVYSHDLVDRL